MPPRFEFNLCMLTCSDLDNCATCIPGDPALEHVIDAVACYRQCKAEALSMAEVGGVYGAGGVIGFVKECFGNCYERVKEVVEACGEEVEGEEVGEECGEEEVSEVEGEYEE